MQEKLLIVIPTYNESDNIELLINKVFQIIPIASVLVVDDNSPDGTAKTVEKLQKEFKNLHILNRNSKSGLASAYIEGFNWGLEQNFEIFCEMDADFSHNPKYIPQMLKLMENFDVVIGSRYIKNGGCENWPLYRQIISRAGLLYTALILGCNIKDMTGGFNMWNRKSLEKINLNSLISKGYLFQTEMKYKAYKNNCTIIEFPIIFGNRVHGKSKLDTKIFLESLINIWKLKQ